jgi:hypothetical protein
MFCKLYFSYAPRPTARQNIGEWVLTVLTIHNRSTSILNTTYIRACKHPLTPNSQKMTFDAMMEKVSKADGFLAALDQSGGSTPKALLVYGIPEDVS